LERDGLVIRTTYPGLPARVEYQLSDLGESLEQVLQDFDRWAFSTICTVIAARDAYSIRHAADRQH
jgi:DNA-binding HxlR family transcriptional regulator